MLNVNVRMTFLADFCAMILAQPRALFPAIAVMALGGGEATVGILAAAIAVGARLAMVFSGSVRNVIHQGRAVVRGSSSWWSLAGRDVGNSSLARQLPSSPSGGDPQP